MVRVKPQGDPASKLRPQPDLSKSVRHLMTRIIGITRAKPSKPLCPRWLFPNGESLGVFGRRRRPA
jgi:hypothetical protein